MISLRLSHLRNFLDEQKVNAALISKPENVRYFSGFTGDSTMLIITHKRNILITDGRYIEQAESEAPKFEVIRQDDGLIIKVADTLNDIGMRSIGIEGNYMTVNQRDKLLEHTDKLKLKLTSIAVDELRQVKDETEIANIQRACDIADKAFDDIVKFIRPGVSEIEVAARLEHVMRQLGSFKPAFDTIVASGLRGTMPHATASNKIIKAGEFVTMDFGAIYNGYHSDITRTVFVGRADNKQRKLYETVLDAQLFALTVIKVGSLGKDIDAKVRTHFEKSGLTKYFIHGLGHGVGLEIHEEPRLSKTSTSEALKANMIVTDEPGIYIPDVGGVRIEDTVLVTDNVAIPLTHSNKKLLELKN